MKKFTFLLVAMLAVAGISRAQMVDDFEHINLNLMLGGGDDNSSMTVVPNPDPNGMNESSHVVKFERSQYGVPWGGFWSALPEPLDLTDNKYVHVRVWKTRISPLKFKIEGGPGPNTEVASMNPQTLTEEWEDIVFDFSGVTGEWNVIAFMPDFEDPLTLEDDIVIYFDYIMANNDPTPGSAAAYVVEDFDHIPLNLMLGGGDDNSSMTVVGNPDPTGVNESGHVVKFERSMNGVPWGGFWSALPVPIDLTDNKFIYVKVWKPRISPLKFKVEGGPSANLEIFSMEPQTLTGEWEEIVFDFSEKTGTWNVIAFMPDFEDPLTLEDDIVIYFDDIRVGGDPLFTRAPEMANQLQVYPNPASDFITIRNSMEIQSLEIYDLAGRIIYSANSHTLESRVDVSDLNQGIYILRVSANNTPINTKINIIRF
jgi:hypothetical protein